MFTGEEETSEVDIMIEERTTSLVSKIPAEAIINEVVEVITEMVGITGNIEVAADRTIITIIEGEGLEVVSTVVEAAAAIISEISDAVTIEVAQGIGVVRTAMNPKMR